MIVGELFWPCLAKNYKPPFLFLKSLSASQKSSRFINSYLRYSWFQNSAIWFAESLFALTKIKIFKPTFIFLQSISTCRKSHWLTLLLLRYSWFKNLKIWLVDSIFDDVQLKIYKTSFRILQSIYNCLPKIMLILKLLPEIQLIQEFCNLIGRKHFWPFLIKNFQ